MSSSIELKKINDLRVIDLKNELEKRGLEKNGVKAVLVERLQKALQSEGLDPDSYLFETSNKGKKLSKSDGERNLDESQGFDDESEKDAAEGPESLIVTDELPDEDMPEVNDNDNLFNMLENSIDPLEATESEPATVGAEVCRDPNENTENKSKAEESDEKIPDANALDAEDSINLDIAEEDKLLAEEEEEHIQDSQKVDEGTVEKSNEESDKIEENVDEKTSASLAEETGKTEETDAKDTNESKKEDQEKSESDDKKKSKEGEDKEKKSEGSGNESRNVWVSNLSSLTRATDLKNIFSKHGKVVGAKIVTNARTPGARCYGYVTMSNSDDASRCIKYLHRIELHGRMISVEKAKGDATGPLKSESRSRRDSSRHDSVSKDKKSSDSKTEKKKPTENGKLTQDATNSVKSESSDKKDSGHRDSDKKTTESKTDQNKGVRNGTEKPKESKDCKEVKEENKDKPRPKHPEDDKAKPRDDKRDNRERDGRRSIHSRSPFRKRYSPRKEVLSFSHIKEERERQRLREKDRRLREEAKRRREEFLRQRNIERRQKIEAARIAREREKLRLEKEKIEREKAELLRMERERQRLERERIEREKEELRLQQKKLEAARRSTKKRLGDERRDFPEKRPALDLTHFDAPPPPRFTEEDRIRERSRRDDFDSYRRRESNASRRDEFSRKSSSPHGGKDRFDRDRDRGRDRDVQSSSFRSRDDHRGKGSSDWRSSSSNQSGKPFAGMGGSSGPSARDPWASSDRKPDGNSSWGRSGNAAGERWVSNPSNIALLGRAPSGNVMPSALYQNQPVAPGMGMGLSLPSNGPYSNDRFDAYKPSLSGMRGKY